MSATHTASRELAEPTEVSIGSTVSFTDRHSGRRDTFTIVAPADAKPQAGSLSVDSPVGGTLLHHHVGDLVEVSTPSGRRSLLITEVG